MNCLSLSTGLERGCSILLTVSAKALLWRKITVVTAWQIYEASGESRVYRNLPVLAGRLWASSWTERAEQSHSLVPAEPAPSSGQGPDAETPPSSSSSIQMGPGAHAQMQALGRLGSSSVQIAKGTGSKSQWQSWCPCDCPLAEWEPLNAGEQLLLQLSLPFLICSQILSYTHTQHRVREPSPQSNRGDKR